MRGSIRTFLGLLLLMLAGSSIDFAADNEIIYILGVAFLGGMIAMSGINEMRKL